MSLFSVVVLITALALSHAAIFERRHGPPDYRLRSSKLETWGSIIMKLDHFSPIDTRTFEMRYIENKVHFKPGGPMVIYLGGEWSLSTGYLENGLIADIGKQHNGYLFYTEHRFYGETQPFPDWSPKSLKYLSVDQALADVAYFITFMKNNNPDLVNSKVVVVGASYSAEMATWMRLKYPHLVDAAWASSAPLQAQVDFPEYYEVVGDNIRLVSNECYNVLEEASKEIEELIQTVEGRDKITSEFGLCTTLRSDFPYNEHFINTITEVWAGNVQYAWPGLIEAECNDLLSSTGSAMAKFGSYVKSKYGGDCVGDYDEFLQYYGTGEIMQYAIYRQWYHQICTEFGYLQTTTSPNQPFGQNTCTPNYFYRVCEDLFGPNYNETTMEHAVYRTNLMYGGNKPVLTNVVSIHGTVDPWHTPGILESLHEDAPARLVEGAAHCQDMGSLSSADTPQMQEAKQLILDSIARWIQ